MFTINTLKMVITVYDSWQFISAIGRFKVGRQWLTQADMVWNAGNKKNNEKKSY